MKAIARTTISTAGSMLVRGRGWVRWIGTGPFVMSTGAFVLVCACGWVGLTLHFFGADLSLGPRGETWNPDLIVVLAGDPARAAYAHTLVQRGVHAEIMTTLTDPLCVKSGRELSACWTGVRNTVDEALLMRRVSVAERITHVGIVTSRYHAARAASIFGIIFAGSGIDVSVMAPPRSPSVLDDLDGHELAKWIPSVAAAMVARFTPPLYEQLMKYRYEAVR